MKKTLSLIIIVSMIFSALLSLYTVHAEEVIKDGVKYVLQNEGGDEPYCTVEEPDSILSGSVTILSEVKIGSKTYPVRSIAAYAFYDSDEITDVTIKGGVEEIGAYAFYSCDKLQTVTFEEGLKRINYDAFEACYKLTAANLPVSLEFLGPYAFSSSGIQTATIRSNVSYIGYSAFARCDNLKTISVASGNQDYKSVGGVLFTADGTSLITYPAKKAGSSYAVPEGVTDIEEYAFSYSSNLTTVTFPSTLAHIDSEAFEYSPSLKSVTIPATVTGIGGSVFVGCTALTKIDVEEGNVHYKSVDGVLFDSVSDELMQYPAGRTAKTYTVPAGTKGIYYEAFYWNGYIEQVIFNEELEFIGSWAFEGCSKLNTPTLPDSLKDIGRGSFIGTCVVYEKYDGINYLGTASNKYYACVGIDEDRSEYTLHPDTKVVGSDSLSYNYGIHKVVLPEGLLYIGHGAFDYDLELTDVNIPSTVKEINGYAFYFVDIKSATIPGSVETVGYNAFEYTSVENVVIEEGVKELESCVFNYCFNLKTVTIPASMTNIGYSAFGSCESLETVYYGGSKAQWENLTKDLDPYNQPLKDANVIFAVTALLGDVTGDGKINNKDVVALFRYVSSDETGGDPAVYDFNGDGKINNKDVVALFRYVSSL
ncbi:MAG: leucine-rich repeat protein [Clostridia bacterium]|nr:leucine-rich repeat protein [Clostridia bacterium]